MSRLQDPHRPFFPFGNPFKMISPKGSQLSSRLKSLLDAFEETLAERLRKLNPKDKSDVLSLSWMKFAVESLCETHNDVKTLITDLELPVSDWDEKWRDMYLDISVKLLDICIAFSSELTRLNQGHLLLKWVLHNLKSNTSEQLVRARSSLDSWRQLIRSKNPRVDNCGTILDDLVVSLDLPKAKNSDKGKVLMRAMYGFKAATVFLCSIFAAAFSGSVNKLLDLNVPDTFSWAHTFRDLQMNVNGEIRSILSSGTGTVLKELDAVDVIVKKLYPWIQDGVAHGEIEVFQNSMSELERAAGKLSLGLDVLIMEVDSFFKIVLTGRDALLCNLRAAGTFSEPMLASNVEHQAVR
ncbi:protein BPS1, chloroplastic-like [Tripterygium wilfordii]|uniref:protein BPS1, chloroplastic-like n=1 Tax=Tripterygium wilfordii TaxID=458696 RepID=UPI0018F7F414|nr:protein BPS1, chloroplastic-like [Tripterygium wilfordii]XP_038709647.1 protein BPS1, chloroplastic-like [Tripterygium wilfordii]